METLEYCIIGGGIWLLLGFIIMIIMKLTEKKKEKQREKQRAEERARQERIKKEEERIKKEKEQMEKINKPKRIEALKNKIKETEKLCAFIEKEMQELYGRIISMSYRDHCTSLSVSEKGIRPDRYGATTFRFDENSLPDLKEEQLADFCVAILQLMEESILEKDNSLHLFLRHDHDGCGKLLYKGKPIEGSW